MSRKVIAGATVLELVLAVVVGLVASPSLGHAEAGPTTPLPSPEVIRQVRGQVGPLFQDRLDWLLANTARWRGQFVLKFSVSSTLPSGAVGFAEGSLYLSESARTLEGEGPQVFSDRRFDPQRADRIRISIDLTTSVMTVKLLTWGNAEATVNLQPDGEVLHGMAAPPARPAYWNVVVRKEHGRTGNL